MNWASNFREAFCRRFQCPQEEFEKRVFWRSLYRRSLPLAWALFAIRRRYFELDFRTIRQLGICRNAAEFRSELDSYRMEYRMERGFLRNTLRVRVSGKRLMALLGEVAPES